MMEKWSGRPSDEETLGRELNKAKIQSKVTPVLRLRTVTIRI